MAKEKKATGEPKKRTTSRKKTADVAPSTPEMEQPTAETASGAKQPPATAHSAQGAADAEEIRRRAYQLWEQRGGTHGSHEDDWYRAEAEIRNKRSA